MEKHSLRRSRAPPGPAGPPSLTGEGTHGRRTAPTGLHADGRERSASQVLRGLSGAEGSSLGPPGVGSTYRNTEMGSVRLRFTSEDVFAVTALGERRHRTRGEGLGLPQRPRAALLASGRPCDPGTRLHFSEVRTLGRRQPYDQTTRS